MIGPSTRRAQHALEEAFCRDVDNLLIDRLRFKASAEEEKAKLATAASLTDAKLIDQLASLGISAAGVPAVLMLPMVLVAWADHRIDIKERRYILSEAKRCGLQARSEAYALLQHWLDHRPPVIVFDTWKRLIQHELSLMGSKSKDKLIASTKAQMKSVARTAGGFFGFHRVSENERKLTDAISKVLDELKV